MYNHRLKINRLRGCAAKLLSAGWTNVSAEYEDVFAFERSKWRVGVIAPGTVTVVDTRKGSMRDYTREGLREILPANHIGRYENWGDAREFYPRYVARAVEIIMDESEKLRA